MVSGLYKGDGFINRSNRDIHRIRWDSLLWVVMVCWVVARNRNRSDVMKNRVVVIFHNFISESNRLYFSNSKRFNYPRVVCKRYVFICCCVLNIALSGEWSSICFFFNNNIVKVHITCVRYIQRIGNCISYFRCVFICCLCNRYTLQYVLGSGKNFSDIVYNAQARTSKIIRCYCVFDCCCSCFEWTVNRNIVVTINR